MLLGLSCFCFFPHVFLFVVTSAFRPKRLIDQFNLHKLFQRPHTSTSHGPLHWLSFLNHSLCVAKDLQKSGYNRGNVNWTSTGRMSNSFYMVGHIRSALILSCPTRETPCSVSIKTSNHTFNP